jgi:hypothetical protein
VRASNWSRELGLGVYSAVVSNLGLAAFLNNPFESSTRTWLLLMGAANELLGVLLIASPELLDRASAAASLIGRRSRPLRRWLARQTLRLLGLTHHISVKVQAAAALSAAGGLSARLVRRPPKDADVKALVDWLIQEHARHHDRLHELEVSVQNVPPDVASVVAGARTEMEDFSREQARRVAEARLVLRLLGLACVVIGIILSGAGNVA